MQLKLEVLSYLAPLHSKSFVGGGLQYTEVKKQVKIQRVTLLACTNATET